LLSNIESTLKRKLKTNYKLKDEICSVKNNEGMFFFRAAQIDAISIQSNDKKKPVRINSSPTGIQYNATALYL